MARQSRQSSGTGIYHVMMRGINHQNIFEDEEDYYQFINILDRMRVSCLTKQNVPYSCDSRIMELPIASWSGLLESGED